MKRIVAVLFASAAFVVPGSAAFAAPDSSQPAGYECNTLDRLGDESLDGVTNCGANRNA